MKAFGYLVSGSMEIIPEGEGMGRVEGVIKEWVEAVKGQVVEGMDTELADQLVDTMEIMCDTVRDKMEKGKVDASMFLAHTKDLFYFVIRALGVYNNYRLLNKSEPDHISAQKQKCDHILATLHALTPSDSKSLIDKYMATFF